MLHEILPVGPLACNCQILGDETAATALVIDPGDDIERIQQRLRELELTVEKIVFTHAHIDHIGQAAALKKATGAPSYLHPLEEPILASLDRQAAWLGAPPPEPIEIDHPLAEGEPLHFAGLPIEILFTPGHSPGSVSLWMPDLNKLISGDVLFRDSIGRTDLPGGDHHTLLDSIRTRILPLDDAVEVFPGHGPPTTVGREREHNPFLVGLT